MGHDPASRRVPARPRFLGSTKSGTRDAWGMHVTSIALIPLAFAFVSVLLSLIGKDYAGARAELSHPFAGIVLVLFIAAAVWHMKTGMQSIIDDYVHSQHAKEWALVANALFSGAVGLASLFAVLKLSLS